MRKTMITAAIVGAGLAAPFAAQAQMQPMSSSELAAVSGQGYVLSLNGMPLFEIPGLYEVNLGVSPVPISNLVGLLENRYPDRVGSARMQLLEAVNARLALVSEDIATGLPVLPFIGPIEVLLSLDFER